MSAVLVWSSRFKKVTSCILLLVLMGLVLWLRMKYASLYPYHEDEAITAEVSRSIVETGLPLRDNGSLYWRSLLGSYLLSLPLFFADLSPLSLRLIPIFFSVLVLPVVYCIGRSMHSAWSGWIAVIFLAFSSYQNLYAEMARFYMPFQFFFVVTVFFAHDYFVMMNRKRGWLLFASVVCAVATHKLALMIAPVCLAAVLIQRQWRPKKTKAFWLAVVFLSVLSYALLFYTPTSAHQALTAIPLRIGAYPDKAAYFRAFAQYTPFGLSFVAIALLFAIESKASTLRFYLAAFLLGMFMLSFLAPELNPRYMNHLFPLGVIVSSVAITLACTKMRCFFKAGKSSVSLRKLPQYIIAGALVLGSFLIVDKNHISASVGYDVTYYDQGAAHYFLSERVKSDDLVMTVEPGLTKLYLNKDADYFLREKRDKDTGEYSTYSDKERAESSIPMIDSPDKMQSLLAKTQKRVWLYANKKIIFLVSEEMDALIKKNFRSMYVKDQTYVLLRGKE